MRVGRARHVVVLERPQHEHDGVDLADVGEELVAEALALARPLDEAADVDDLHRGVHDVAALGHRGQPVEALVGHLGDADVRVLGGERVRRGERAAAGEGVVQRALARVGEADEAEAFHAADDAIGGAGRYGAVAATVATLGTVDLAVRRAGRSRADRRRRRRRRGRRAGTACSCGTTCGTARCVPFADPWVDAGGGRRGDRAGHDRHDGRRRCRAAGRSSSPRPTTTLDRLSGGRMVLGLGLGVDSYGEYSVFDEPADRRQGPRRGARRRHRAARADARRGDARSAAGCTMAPGVQQPRVPIWIAGRTGFRGRPPARRPPRAGGPGAGRRRRRGRRPHVADALAAGGLTAGELDVVLVGGDAPRSRRPRRRRRDVVHAGDPPRRHRRRRPAQASAAPADRTSTGRRQSGRST